MTKELPDYQGIYDLRNKFPEGYCLPLSLYEISHFLHGTPLPTLEEVEERFSYIPEVYKGSREGYINSAHVFDTILAISGQFSPMLSEIEMRGKVQEYFPIPSEYGNVPVDITYNPISLLHRTQPVIAVYADKIVPGSIINGHAETYDGSPQMRSRNMYYAQFYELVMVLSFLDVS